MEINTEAERRSDRVDQPLEGIAAKDQLLAERRHGQHQQIEDQQKPLVRPGPQRHTKTADEDRRHDGQQQQPPSHGCSGAELAQHAGTRHQPHGASWLSLTGKSDAQSAEADQQQEQEHEPVDGRDPVAGAQSVCCMLRHHFRKKGVHQRDDEDTKRAHAGRMRMRRRSGWCGNQGNRSYVV